MILYQNFKRISIILKILKMRSVFEIIYSDERSDLIIEK